MKLYKVYNGESTYYFTKKTLVARLINYKEQNILYLLKYKKQHNEWIVEETEDPNILNGDIDSCMPIELRDSPFYDTIKKNH